MRWHAEGHARHPPDTYPAYLRFLSHDMMPAMRERQELLQPLRADAAALLALLAADPAVRQGWERARGMPLLGCCRPWEWQPLGCCHHGWRLGDMAAAWQARV